MSRLSAVDLVRRLGKGALLVKSDIESAFRLLVTSCPWGEFFLGGCLWQPGELVVLTIIFGLLGCLRQIWECGMNSYAHIMAGPAARTQKF